MKNQKLPDMCYLFRPAGGPGRYIAVIHNGELGFSTTSYDEKDARIAQSMVAHMNRKLGITPVIAECMQTGSMFGWDVDGADPDFVGRKTAMNQFDLVRDEENLFEA